MKKKLIGYKLKDQKYRDAFLNLLPNAEYTGREVGLEADLMKELNIKIMEDLGLLDLWFDPVYEELPKLKVGDYIIMIDPFGFNKERNYLKYQNDILKITGIEKDSYQGDWITHAPESFSGGGFRSHKSAWEYGVHFRLATEEEIKTVLIKEAISRGFKEGLNLKNCKTLNIKGEHFTGCTGEINSNWVYNIETDKLENRCAIIYINGKWAEILPEVKESLIGKKYYPKDNSYIVNLTSCLQFSYKNEITNLAGTVFEKSKECIIVSEPFTGIIDEYHKYEMIIVEYNNQTFSTLFFEDCIK